MRRSRVRGMKGEERESTSNRRGGVKVYGGKRWRPRSTRRQGQRRGGEK